MVEPSLKALSVKIISQSIYEMKHFLSSCNVQSFIRKQLHFAFRSCFMRLGLNLSIMFTYRDKSFPTISIMKNEKPPGVKKFETSVQPRKQFITFMQLNNQFETN